MVRIDSPPGPRPPSDPAISHEKGRPGGVSDWTVYLYTHNLCIRLLRLTIRRCFFVRRRTLRSPAVAAHKSTPESTAPPGLLFCTSPGHWGAGPLELGRNNRAGAELTDLVVVKTTRARRADGLDLLPRPLISDPKAETRSAPTLPTTTLLHPQPQTPKCHGRSGRGRAGGCFISSNRAAYLAIVCARDSPAAATTKDSHATAAAAAAHPPTV